MRWLVLFLIMMTGPAQSQQPYAKTESTQKSAKSDQRGTAKSPLIVEVIPSEDAKKESAENANERKEKLQLDRDLVKFTDYLQLFTGLLCFVALLQLVVFGMQARRLRQSVEEMKTATIATREVAAAAENTNQSIRDAIKRQLRAYVGLEDMFFRYTDPNDVNSKLTNIFRIRIMNFGQTPAFDMYIGCKRVSKTEGLPATGSLASHVETLTVSCDERILNPKQPHGISIDAQWDMDFENMSEFFTLGRVVYRDIYHDWWTSDFGFVSVPGGNVNRPRFDPYGNYNKEHGPYKSKAEAMQATGLSL